MDLFVVLGLGTSVFREVCLFLKAARKPRSAQRSSRRYESRPIQFLRSPIPFRRTLPGAELLSLCFLMYVRSLTPVPRFMGHLPLPLLFSPDPRSLVFFFVVWFCLLYFLAWYD